VTDDWWKAHRLEVYITLAIVGLSALVWLVDSLVDAMRERRRKKDAGIL
jgi:hypothetical protein